LIDLVCRDIVRKATCTLVFLPSTMVAPQLPPLSVKTVGEAPDAQPDHGDCPMSPRTKRRRRVQSCAEEGEGSRLLMQGFALIGRVPLFASLTASEYPKLVGAFTSAEYEAGAVVIEQGSPGHQLLVIDGGKARLERKDTSSGDATPSEPRVLQSGDAVGEKGLLYGEPWRESLIAVDRLRVWCLEVADFERLGLWNKLRLKRRMAALKMSIPDYKGDAPIASDQTDEERAFLRKSLFANPVLRPLISNMTEGEVDKVISRAEKREVEHGLEVVRHGELYVEHFYIVAEGHFMVINKDRELVEQLGPGNSFGEQALLFREPRKSTVRAHTNGIVWQVRRDAFGGFERAQRRRKLQEYSAILQRVDAFRDMPKSEHEILSDALVEVALNRGERLLEEGQVMQNFYIVLQGSVTMMVQRGAGFDVSRKTACPGAEGAQFFGEAALTGPEDENSRRSRHSIVVASERVIAMVLPRRAFLAITKPLEAAQASQAGVFCKACNTPLQLPSRICPTCETKPSISVSKMVPTEETHRYQQEQFEELGLLGSGRFAKVSLVKDKATGGTFALKQLTKALIAEKKQEQNVLIEKMVLKMTKSLFIVRLFATFNQAQHLYFLLEAVLGGDLLTFYERHDNFFGSASHARFYIACVLSGLEHLHDRYIIYRDLKMENVMMHSSGYVKLTDFGLSKFVIGHTFTKCGTPDYMAPEIIAGSGHTSAADWWALGVLTYALMEGALPFDSSQSCLIFWKVQRGIEHVDFSDASASWAELVKSLCKQEPRERLPIRAGGAKGIQEHPWYSDAKFDWGELESQKMAAPFVPALTGPTDRQHFEPEAGEPPPAGAPYVDDGSGWDADFEDPVGPLNTE